MDRKTQIKPQIQPQRYPSQKNFNRNYISEPKIDNDHIDTTYSNFSSGEYENILEIIESNQILNFRNTKGETLIHAIIKNPASSLDETKILDIIQKLVHKNVSINAMNEYNQTPMHLAAKIGYYEIVNYLISLKSDFNKIDNYGNGPIHYIIDKFVSECKEGEYFKFSNKNIKKSLKMNKYEIMAEKYLILSIIDEIQKHTGSSSDKPIDFLHKLRQIVQYYKFYKITDITAKIDETKIKIDNLYRKISPVSLESDIKTILFDCVTEFNNIYTDLKFENKLDKSGESELINDNTLDTIKTNVNLNKIKCLDDFNKKISDLKNNIESVETVIKQLLANMYTLFKILYFSYYIHKTCSAVESHEKYTIEEAKSNVKTQTEKLIKEFYSDKEDTFYDFEDIVKIKDNVLSKEDLLDNKTMFIRTGDFAPGTTINTLPLWIDRDATRHPEISAHENYPDWHDHRSDHVKNIDMKYIQNNFLQPRHGDGPLYNKFCKLSVLLNILNYIDKYLKLIKEINIMYTIDTYPYLYLNYYDEIIINIINNLIIFKRQYELLKINDIMYQFVLVVNSLNIIENPIYGVLLSQLEWMPEKNVYDTRDRDDAQLLIKMNEIEIKTVIENLQHSLNIQIIFGKTNDIYVKLLDIYKTKNDIIEFVNKHYSLKYLESLTLLIKTNPISPSTPIKIDNFFTNKFYPNTSTFPINITSYKDKYFPEYNFDHDALKSIKINLLKKYYDYDLNQLFNKNDYSTSNLQLPYNKIEIITLRGYYHFEITLDNKDIKFATDNFHTGYNSIIYTDPSNNIINNSIFSKDFLSNLTYNVTLKWLTKDSEEYDTLIEPIPIISLDNVKNLIQLITFKIIELFTNTNIRHIITETQEKLKISEIPNQILTALNDSFSYLLESGKESLLKKVIVEKLIIFINSYISLQINEEINKILLNINDKYLTSPLKKLSDDNIILDVRSQFEIQLKEYTLNTRISELLTNTNINTFKTITDAMIKMDSSLLAKSGERKLLQNKCIINNKVDLLKNRLFGKINLRVLDKNGNTILNRLIDQFNEYAISQVLTLDPEIYTYQNNRGQNSIEYLHDVINSIDKNYTWEALDKRIRSYEYDLQMWIKAEGSFEEIELDENKHMIYNIILNSLYLFNECMWLILLKSPNGWKYEDKIKVKELIKKVKNFNITEKLLIKSLTDEDKTIIKTKITNDSLKKKISDMINEHKNEISSLTNSNLQLEEEKKSIELVDESDLDLIIVKNQTLILEKTTEIANLEGVSARLGSLDKNIDDIFKEINDAILINEITMNWYNYNLLVKDHLWNFYLPIIQQANDKNKNSSEKYMSFYNYGLFNLDYKIIDDNEIKLLVDYNSKIINNIYGDYYDLEKYEDIEYNYINDIILNIIYLNVVNVIGIEMYTGLIEYLTNKYTSNDKIKEVIENYKEPKVFILFDIIQNLLKNCVWEKLGSKNPDITGKYKEFPFYSNELKLKIKEIFGLLNNEDDNLIFDKIINFYKGICENVAYNVNSEIVNFLNDLKKHSLLFGILGLINKKK
jgi:hypothetical protein